MFDIVISTAVFFSAATFNDAIQQAHDAGGGVVRCEAGQYLIDEPIIWLPNVDLELSTRCKIIANSPMDAMIKTGADKLTRQRLTGGIMEGKDLAEKGIRIPTGENVSITGARLYDFSGSAIHLGQPTGKAGYEYRLSDIEINDRQGVVIENAGILLERVSDSHFTDIVISGFTNGVKGSVWSSDFTRVHPWAYGPTQDPMQIGFDLRGSYNTLSQCYSDNAHLYFFRFDGGSWAVNSCRTLNRTTTDTDTAFFLMNGANVSGADNTIRARGSLASIWRNSTGDNTLSLARTVVERP